MSGRCPDGALLLEFVEGIAEPAEVGRVETHLAMCPSCRAEVESLQRLRDALRAPGLSVVRAELPVCESAGRHDAGLHDPSAYIAGTMRESERVSYEQHLTSCPWCRAELSDLMTAHHPDAPDVSEAAVAVVLDRLGRAGSRVLLRSTGDALRFIEGWIESATEFVARTGYAGREPALAGVRSDSAPVTLHWELHGGYAFDCELTGAAEGSELVGRVLRSGSPALDVSVALRGDGTPVGPESVDTAGRFGPWALALGASELTFLALNLPGGSLGVTIEVEAAAPDEAD